MDKNLVKPDFIFETSWEVCNKVGGIHTVVSTKALSLFKEYGDNLILIGPDVWRSSRQNPEFLQDDNLFAVWREHAKEEGLNVRIGRWNIVGKPVVILVDFTPFIERKNEIFAKFWELYKLDSLSGQWDYIEPASFGYAAGKVIDHFCQYNLSPSQKAVAHFHEWMTGTGVLYLKHYAPHIATVFTTHATVLGRSIAGNGQPLYSKLHEYNGDVKAKEFNVVAKQSCEKTSAMQADCFTTVSEITARECKQFLEKQPDIVTPNGFEDDFVPVGDDFLKKRNEAKTVLRKVSEALLGYELPDDTKFIGTAGRYEYHNKGIDVFIESLKEAERVGVAKNIVAFILVPANNYGARQDLAEKLAGEASVVNTDGFNKYLTHGLHDADYDPILNQLKNYGLDNAQDKKIKVIFVPSYLNGNDGIFNKTYYDVLVGLDLTIFPSYYEPWGYTPLESLAFHIPTVTTNLAGFGQWIKNQNIDSDSCLKVVERTDDNFFEAATNIASIIKHCSEAEESHILKSRETAYKVSRTALWENLVEYYYRAYDIALKKAEDRVAKMNIIQPTRPLQPVKRRKINRPIWRTIQVQPNLEGKFEGLKELAYNLWWSWNDDAIELWEYIGNNGLWKKSRYNPLSLLKEVTLERFTELENDAVFLEKYHEVYYRFKSYMAEKEKAEGPLIGYFCMEYGISDTLKIFSGGLGILAGDYLKEASDSNVRMIAVGLMYKYGYFYQQITLSGEQLAIDEPQDFRKLPIIPVKDDEGNYVIVKLALPGRVVNAQIWKVQVGRIDLYLLDTDREDNQEQDRTITHHLYGGDRQNRLKQEMLLGVGGIRALRKLKIEPDIYHMNEGHAALIGIERMNQLIRKKNFTFSEALEIVRSSTIFTTHTPVPAGHDTFPEDMIMTYMGHYPERLHISWKDFIGLGKIDPDDKVEEFSMSHLAANLSQEMNGVSMLHGEVTKHMFNKLWEGYYSDELHIGYVTNGVHYPTWTEKRWKELYEKHFGKNFFNDQSNSEHWAKINYVSDEEIWELRQKQRSSLIAYINERLDSNWVKRREFPANIVKIKQILDPNALTIGFARRFATYKRGNLIFRHIDDLARIVNNAERPVQFVFAGKAHPHDGGGQAIIKQIIEISKRPEFLGKIIFLENYDMNLAKKLVSGVDIWLNTPTRPLEASGTSGMKAVMNGALHFSVLDGWWVEGYREKAGWALDQEQLYEDHEYQNELDAQMIYHLLENEIVPLFYERDENGVPRGWVEFIKNSISQIAPDFTMKRMIDDYFDRFYNKLYERGKKMKQDDYKLAKELAAWKKRVERYWDNIRVLKTNFYHIVEDPLYVGEEYFGEVVIDLGELNSNEIGVEMVMTEILPDGTSQIENVMELELMRQDGKIAHYKIEMTPYKSGNFNYGFRIYPKHPKLPHRQDFSYVRWI